VVRTEEVAPVQAPAEKATRTGYHVDDVPWYNPTVLADLVPLALDATWETGNRGWAADAEERRPVRAGPLLAVIFECWRP
jgi:hypothetical protein